MSNTKLDEFETVDGVYSSGCITEVESIAQALVDLVEGFPEILEDNCNIDLEIEGRIGTIMSDTSRERIKLPCEGLTLLAPSDKDFPYRFVPGVQKWQMQAVIDELKRNLEETKIPYKVNTRNTSDYYVLNSENSSHSDKSLIRVSFISPKTATDKPVDAIWKEKIAIFDFYSPGYNNDIDGHCNYTDQTFKDFRIAINIEHKENPTLIMNSLVGQIENVCVLERRRNRETLDVSTFILDATNVTQIESRRGYRHNETYELELELKSSHFLPLLKSYVKELNNGNLKIIGQHSFIHNPNSKNSDISKIIDLTMCTQSEELIEYYRKYICPITPILGDYLYRAIAKNKIEYGRDEPLSETDIKVSLGILPIKVDKVET
ncbi:mRNA capping enzyme, beta chain family protein [Cryptosporidium muris RN66]|uniref:mRNA 5'-phosphatase n=1 Tax=Cryptosporidium muris (strain RN66) TaxID=441375 RepID=B6A973_CRYMR|nr:mRNA capping enzyme, beta chain family protein [Cryptosporidium muris RN66]EEA04764.1 mRNA capping enzyme, beta chain family protein [Cryptosporidium muris RN66]|eukprot:XP_002139113.1 mRNA capping enzyme, beta chain family protein [Cryptosporidium muris RN66]